MSIPLQVMVGYLNNPKATAEIISPDGWMSSGDIGYYNENNNFFIVDRIKELIKVQGFQVSKKKECFKIVEIVQNIFFFF